MIIIISILLTAAIWLTLPLIIIFFCNLKGKRFRLWVVNTIFAVTLFISTFLLVTLRSPDRDGEQIGGWLWMFLSYHLLKKNLLKAPDDLSVNDKPKSMLETCIEKDNTLKDINECFSKLFKEYSRNEFLNLLYKLCYNHIDYINTCTKERSISVELYIYELISTTIEKMIKSNDKDVSNYVHIYNCAIDKLFQNNIISNDEYRNKLTTINRYNRSTF